jgi:hypothetical protein
MPIGIHGTITPLQPLHMLRIFRFRSGHMSQMSGDASLGFHLPLWSGPRLWSLKPSTARAHLAEVVEALSPRCWQNLQTNWPPRNCPSTSSAISLVRNAGLLVLCTSHPTANTSPLSTLAKFWIALTCFLSPVPQWSSLRPIGKAARALIRFK